MIKRFGAFAFCLCVLLGALNGCTRGSGSPDIDFAQKTVNLLLAGDQSAQPMLDWDNLFWMGTNIGETYRLLPDEPARSGYRTQFVTSAAAEFQKMHANAATFSNWRVEAQDAAQASIIADTHHEAKLRVTVSKSSGQLKVAAVSVG